jgi:hypothetical protein
VHHGWRRGHGRGLIVALALVCVPLAACGSCLEDKSKEQQSAPVKANPKAARAISNNHRILAGDSGAAPSKDGS